MESLKKIIHQELKLILNERVFWTLEKVQDIASGYDKLSDFRREHPNALQWATKNGHLSTVTSHMTKERQERSREELEHLASQFTKLTDFRKQYPNEYRTITQKGWNDILSHLESNREKWTLDKVLELARKVKNMEEFRTTYPKAYDVSRRHEGWKEEVWKLFKPQQIEWTYDLAKKYADEYDDLTDFQNNEPKALAAIRRKGWLDLLGHLKKDKRTWTDDEIRQEAKKYDSVKDFREKSTQAYYAAQSHGIYDEVTNHMDRFYTTWTKDMVWKEALKYQTRSDFQRGNNGAYQAAHINGWDNEVMSHMERKGNLYNRMVYAYEFPDNSVYVGLTLNIKDRDIRHKTKERSAVFQHIKKTGLTPELKKITDDYINAEDARNMENCTVEKYRQEGWNVLNVAPTGGLGSVCVRQWTKDEIINIAKKFTSPSPFKSKFSSAYNFAKRNGWLPEVTQHMTKKKIKWTREMLIDRMTPYENMTQFRNRDDKGFAAAYRILGNQFIKDFYKK
jgi:predicted GIY-YIG superfamily endonuclease